MTPDSRPSQHMASNGFSKEEIKAGWASPRFRFVVAVVMLRSLSGKLPSETMQKTLDECYLFLKEDEMRIVEDSVRGIDLNGKIDEEKRSSLLEEFAVHCEKLADRYLDEGMLDEAERFNKVASGAWDLKEEREKP